MTDAERNATAKLADIVLLVTAMDAAQRLDGNFFTPTVRKELDMLGIDVRLFIPGRPGHSASDLTGKIHDLILESALSVQVRCDWYSPGPAHAFPPAPAEAVKYEILLTTGNPAVRIVGSLGLYGEPNGARLEHEDWGTSWTACHTTVSEDDMLLTYAQQFYLGG